MAALLQRHDQSGCDRLLESLSACNQSGKCRQLSHCRKNTRVCRVPLNLNDVLGLLHNFGLRPIRRPLPRTGIETRPPRQPRNFCTLPRIGETKGCCAVLDYQASKDSEDRAAYGSHLVPREFSMYIPKIFRYLCETRRTDRSWSS